MIKRQYFEWPRIDSQCYFHKFLDSTQSDNEVVSELKKYDASLGKSKHRHCFNVKWHDARLYTLFVMRWS